MDIKQYEAQLARLLKDKNIEMKLEEAKRKEMENKQKQKEKYENRKEKIFQGHWQQYRSQKQ